MFRFSPFKFLQVFRYTVHCNCFRSLLLELLRVNVSDDAAN